jgi:hypothetical protein
LQAGEIACLTVANQRLASLVVQARHEYQAGRLQYTSFRGDAISVSERAFSSADVFRIRTTILNMGLNNG